MKIHNIIQNNLKLIKDDVIAAMRVKTASYEDKELYAKENRREVLYLYRHMLKNIPIMFDRKLERVNNYEVYIVFIRKSSSILERVQEKMILSPSNY